MAINYTSEFTGQHNDEYDERIASLLNIIQTQQEQINNLKNSLIKYIYIPSSDFSYITNYGNTKRFQCAHDPYYYLPQNAILVTPLVYTTNASGMCCDIRPNGQFFIFGNGLDTASDITFQVLLLYI